ncbi:hypothetical protein [Streptobacillus notomytis]|uniref:hypothetical protein n=1 Tax=Streptobacillus notomytis TaxID=1712031 RepID=UPI0009366263|nr:hypothetical protein [Streptobacillus notomytis]
MKKKLILATLLLVPFLGFSQENEVEEMQEISSIIILNNKNEIDESEIKTTGLTGKIVGGVAGSIIGSEAGDKVEEDLKEWWRGDKND